MTNLLIPTDFTAASVTLIGRAIQASENRPLNITLFHAFEIPFFMQDVLGNATRQPHYELLTDAFRHACKQLKDQYPKMIGKINFKCMQGNTTAVFRNFIDANDIDIILYPDDFIYQKIHERSINPLPFFKNAGIPVLNELKPIKQTVNYRVKSFAATELGIN